MFIQYVWQGNHQTYGHIRCIHTVLANPKNAPQKCTRLNFKQWCKLLWYIVYCIRVSGCALLSAHNYRYQFLFRSLISQRLLTRNAHTHTYTHTHTHTHTLRPTWEACLPLCACNSTHILFRRLALLLLLRLLPPMKCLPYHLPWCPYPWLHPVHSFRHKGKAEWGEITVLACFHVCFSVVFSLGYF
jgi:hypothetical protein